MSMKAPPPRIGKTTGKPAPGAKGKPMPSKPASKSGGKGKPTRKAAGLINQDTTRF